MYRRTAKGALLICSWLLLASCSSEPLTRGYVPDQDRLAELQPGVHDRNSVEEILGSPSNIGTFQDSTWYYVTRHTEKLAFFEEEVKEQQVVAIQFDDAGLVSEIRQYSLDDAQVIEPVDRVTPTRGRELTIIEQLIGNIGRFQRGGAGEQ